MKYRPSLSLVSVATVLLVLAAAWGLVWYKVNSVPPKLREKMSLLETLKFKDTLRTNPPTDEQIAAQRKPALILKEKLTAEFPALRVIAKPVPDEINAYLLLHQLGGSGNPFFNHLPMSEEFKNFLYPKAAWDPDIARRCLAEHSELVGRIEHIASLTTRSSANMPADFQGYVAGAAGKSACDILLLKARLAAEAGDEDETLRLVAAAENLGSHYHDVECPTLYNETVAVLTGLSIDQAVFKTLLPAIGRRADLGQWKTILAKRRYGTAELAQVMRGEWNVNAEFTSFPTILAGAAKHQLSDVEAVARAETSWFNSCVTRLATCSLADAAAALQAPVDVSHLSKEGRELVGNLSVGTWVNGYIRAATIDSQYQAALELLSLEQAGATLAAADTGRVTRDPVSLTSFEFDALKRVLSAPPGTAALNVTPLAMPW